MRKRKNLILFTSCFPFKHGETFLETEISYLSKAFDKITIIPIVKGENKRPLPENIFVDIRYTNINKNSFERIKKVFNKSSFFKNLQFSLRYNRFLFTWTFYAKSIKDFLEKNYKEDLKTSLLYSYWFNFVPVAFYMLKQDFPEVKFISRAHGSDIFESVHQIKFFPYRDEVLATAEKIFSISETGKHHIISNYLVKEDKIIVARLGTKKNNFRNIASTDGVFRIVSCSNMISIKRIDLLIDTLGILDKRAKIHWYHIGDGPLEEKLKKQAHDKLGNSIQFTFLGRISNDDVYKFYTANSVDLFINLSTSEGIPVSIMEAQSIEIPSLATNVGGTHEIVNNQNGWLVDKQINNNELAKILESIYIEKNKLQSKRQSSLNNWEENYDAETNYNKFIEIIKQIKDAKNSVIRLN